MRRLCVTIFLTIVAVATDHAQTAPPAQPRPADSNRHSDQYLVEFNRRLPQDLPARVAHLGGEIVEAFPEINVALVRNLTPSAVAALSAQFDVADVTEDVLASDADVLRDGVLHTARSAPRTSAHTSPMTATWLPYQWNMRAIGADRAWQAGYLGRADIRLAVIDTGIDPTYPALAGRIDTARSRSFCAAEDALVQQEFPGYPAWTDLDGHGTLTASIAAGDGEKLASVAPRTTIMALKGLGIVRCPWSAAFRSIYYAANNGADVINISSGTFFPLPKAGQRGWFHYVNLAIRYALQRGVSAVVVSAMNAAVDLDHNRDGVAIYCDVPGVICVSATGPTNSGPDFLGPFLETDAPAFYTNFGSSAIDVGAPGGNLSFDSSGNILGYGLVWGACAGTDRSLDANGNLVPGICSSGGYDLVGSIGTSFAAPHVSGLAALLVAELGRGQAAKVSAIIRNTADDLGRVGVDPVYGRGRISVAAALGVR